MKPKIDPSEWILTLDDVKQLYIANRRRLLKWALLGATLVLLWVAKECPKYKAEATFKQAVEKGTGESLIKDLISGMGSAPQPEAVTLMKSRQVLKPLVESLGLQIHFCPPRRPITKVFKKLRQAFQIERGQFVDDLDPFVFQDTQFELEKPFSFSLLFSDPLSFSVCKDKKEVCKGAVGAEVCLSDPPLQFKVTKVPADLKVGVFYPFEVLHWSAKADELRAQLEIMKDKDNDSVLQIAFKHRDRNLAARIVNGIMEKYQEYLQREFLRIAHEQLSYLENKQEEVFQKLGHLIDQQSKYLAANIKENGFIALEESGGLIAPAQQLKNRLLDIDIELSILNSRDKGDKSLSTPLLSPFSQTLAKTHQTIDQLKNKRDLLELSLIEADRTAYHAKRGEIEEIRSQRIAIEQLLQEVEQEGQISSLDFHPELMQWAHSAVTAEEREDFAEYLENYARLLSIREKILQDRSFYGKQAPPELEGIDLTSAQKLLLDYNGKLDQAEASMRHYQRFRKEISTPDFDLASLGTVLKDPFCQKIIAESSQLGIRLKDELHSSAKEKERWEREVELDRKILYGHLDQLCKVEELNVELVRQKMEGLQKVSLDCINREISVLHEQALDSIKERCKSLDSEKGHLEKKLSEIQTAFSSIFPEKWRAEKWLTARSAMVSKVMEAITQVVESKTIATHLHHVESKPLDPAMVPFSPVPIQLKIMVLVGAFGASFFVFCFLFIRQLIKGLPVTEQKLKALRLPFLGSVGRSCDGPRVEAPTGSDLDLLRQLALFIEGKKVISLIGAKGPDYSFALAENLSRKSTRSILLRCDFLSKYQKEDMPGLLQLWKGEERALPIRKGKGFDYITSGGYSPFGPEIIQSPQFCTLLTSLKEKYDQVILFFCSPLASAESMAALKLCEKAVVTVSGEQIEELTPFIDWAYDEEQPRLTFITRS